MTLLAIASGAIAAATPAGTVLRNQAQVRYLNPLTGQVVTQSSNVSQLVVAPYRDVLLGNNNALTVAAGQRVNLPHVLTNTGNVDDNYSLTAVTC